MIKRVLALMFLGAMLCAGSGLTAAGEAEPPPAPPPAAPGVLPAGSAILVIPAAILIGIAVAVSGGESNEPAFPAATGTR